MVNGSVHRDRRIAAARASLRRAANAKMLAEEAGPPCRECFYCGDEKPVPVCHHLVYSSPRYDPALGRFEGRSLRLVTAARSEDGLCGPEALLFEAKSALVRAKEALTSERATAVLVSTGIAGIILASVWLY